MYIKDAANINVKLTQAEAKLGNGNSGFIWNIDMIEVLINGKWL